MLKNKTTKTIIFLSLVLAVISFFSFKNTENKLLKFEMTEVQAGKLFQALQVSNAPHNDVVELSNLIMQQYQEQLPKDSTTNKKK